MEQLPITNPQVRELVTELQKRGCKIRYHEKSLDVINIFSPQKKKNIVGDLSIYSGNGYFRLQNRTTGKWHSFRTLKFDIDDEAFVEKVIDYIFG